MFYYKAVEIMPRNIAYEIALNDQHLLFESEVSFYTKLFFGKHFHESISKHSRTTCSGSRLTYCSCSISIRNTVLQVILNLSLFFGEELFLSTSGTAGPRGRQGWPARLWWWCSAAAGPTAGPRWRSSWPAQPPSVSLPESGTSLFRTNEI